jgi:hypothetical protein
MWAPEPSQEMTMTKKDTTKPVKQDGELSEQQLDGIAGGQQQPQVVKMETIVVTAKREQPQQQVVKMGQIQVSAKREKPEASTTLAAATPNSKKN